MAQEDNPPGPPGDTTSTLELIRKEVGDITPEWAAHIVFSLEGVVPASVWIKQLHENDLDWDKVPAIQTALRLTSTSNWMSQNDFIRKLSNPDLEIDVPRQCLERFICTEVLKQLRAGSDVHLNKSAATRVTRNLAGHLRSQAFQRVAADYTWDRVVFDTIPFMVQFAQKVLVEEFEEMPVFNNFPGLLPRETLSVIPANMSHLTTGSNSVKMFAWHLYMEMESSERLTQARELATEIIMRDQFPLHACCRSGCALPSDVAAVLIVEHRQTGDAARSFDLKGNAPLYYAAQRKECDRGRLIRVLYSAGANLNARNEQGLPALAVACRASASIRSVEELLVLGANPLLCDAHGLSPLHYAVRSCRADIVHLLDTYHVDVNAVDNDGFTPAHVAASSGSVPMLELLASMGSSLSATSKNGSTPLRIASKRHHLDAVSFLFQMQTLLAARFPYDPRLSSPECSTECSMSSECLCEHIYDVLSTQLPEMLNIESVSLSGLGLDHVVPELACLKRATKIDLRHNPLRTYWWLPWWWLTCISHRLAFWLSIVFAVLWAVFAAEGIFLPGKVWLDMIEAPGFHFGLGHFAIVLLILSNSFLVFISVHYGYFKPYEQIEAAYPRLLRLEPFRTNQFANILTIGVLLLELIQLSAIMHSIDDSSAVATLLRGFVFDFGNDRDTNRVAVSICIGFVCYCRIWIEIRTCSPRLWALDRLLCHLLIATFVPVTRVLLRSLACHGATSTNETDSCYSTPTDISLFIASIGVLFVHIPTVILSEPVFQARDGDRQLRISPTRRMCIRLLFFFLTCFDVLFNRTDSGPIYDYVYPWIILPLPFVVSFIIGKPVLYRDSLQLRVSIFWAVVGQYAVTLLVTREEYSPGWALLSWPATMVICSAFMQLSRSRSFPKSIAEKRLRKNSEQKEALTQCFRLHPRFSDIMLDYGAGVHFTSLEKKYQLNQWLRSGCSSNDSSQVLTVQDLYQSDTDDTVAVDLPTL
uniref:Uncharacterized protein n=1 Tax=Spongospora subterranea TaxID=70186 RepID=A0A0H5RP65_9EUKA|eukprot:CRZ10519.1 hypothetical protein [Spongospora subterranea]